MKVCTCLLLFRIFALPYSAATGDQKSINLALETVLEFNNKDHEPDVKFLDNVQQFITRVKTVIDKNKSSRRDFRIAKVKTFTSFIQEGVNILNNYNDEAFEEFFKILDEEIRKYHYRGCKFHELTENYETRRLLASKLNSIRGKPVHVTKAQINTLADMIKDEKYDKNVKDFVDYINSLYRQDAEEKFQKVLSDLEQYSKSKSKKANLVKIVRDGVRSIIFDHYTALNPNVRRELKDKIETFWKRFKESHLTSANTKFIPYTQAVVNNIKIPDNITTEFKEPEPINEPKNYSTTTINIKKENKRQELPINNPNIKTKQIARMGISDIQDENHNVGQNQSRMFLSDETFEGNSIEFSQERQLEYNTQRYVTLYTEEISTKRTPKKSKNAFKANEKSNPKSSHSSKHRSRNIPKHERKTGTDHKKISDKKHESKPKIKHKSKHSEHLDIISSTTAKQKKGEVFRQNDTTDGVRSTKMELYEYKRMLEQIRMDRKHEISLDPISVKPISLPRGSIASTKPISSRPTYSRNINIRAEIRTKKPIEQTFLITPTSSFRPSKRYEVTSKQLRDFRKSAAPFNIEEGLSIEEFKREERNKEITRKESNNVTVRVPVDVIKRIDDLERELKEVKRIMINNTVEAKERKVTDEYETDDKQESDKNNEEHTKRDVIVRFVNEDVDSNQENNDGLASKLTIRKTTKGTNNTTTATNNKPPKAVTTKMNIKPASAIATSPKPLNAVKKITGNTTINDKKNNMPITTSLITTNVSKIPINITKITGEVNKEINTNNVRSTVNMIKTTKPTILQSVTLSSAPIRREVAYSSPPYYAELDPFDHMKDGFDFKI